MADEQKAKVARTEPGHSQGKLLTGKKALITGASRGIGAVIATAFAAENATLILTARNVKGLEETASACKAKGAEAVHIVPADCYSMANVDALVKTVLEQHGSIDILVNNAGAVSQSKKGGDDRTKVESPIEGEPDAWSECLTLNLEGPMRLTRAFSPQMAAKKQGVIINISSIAGIDRLHSVPAYCASKWGLEGWSKCCYEALRPHGIKVSCISPGAVDTPMTEFIPGDKKQLIQSQDIAEACLFVCRCSVNAVPEQIVIRTVRHIHVPGFGQM